MNVQARYDFTAADAARAMGMPDHPSLAGLNICILIAPNGTPASAIDSGHAHAFVAAAEKLNAMADYHRREAETLTEPLREAIRLERAGLPMGRTDVNPTQVPALATAPDDYTMARTTKIGVEDGLVDPADIANAWRDVQAQVAAADPPFPPVLKGYTFEQGEAFEVHGDDTISAGTEAVLTVYG